MHCFLPACHLGENLHFSTIESSDKCRSATASPRHAAFHPAVEAPVCKRGRLTENHRDELSFVPCAGCCTLHTHCITSVDDKCCSPGLCPPTHRWNTFCGQSSHEGQLAAILEQHQHSSDDNHLWKEIDFVFNNVREQQRKNKTARKIQVT